MFGLSLGSHLSHSDLTQAVLCVRRRNVNFFHVFFLRRKVWAYCSLSGLLLGAVPLCEDFRAAGCQEAFSIGCQLSMKRILVCFQKNLFTYSERYKCYPPRIGKEKEKIYVPAFKFQMRLPRVCVCGDSGLFSKLPESSVSTRQTIPSPAFSNLILWQNS